MMKTIKDISDLSLHKIWVYCGLDFTSSKIRIGPFDGSSGLRGDMWYDFVSFDKEKVEWTRQCRSQNSCAIMLDMTPKYNNVNLQSDYDLKKFKKRHYVSYEK